MKDLIRQWINRNEPRRVQALQFHLRGLSYTEIGKELGVSRQRAQQLLRPPIAIYHSVRRKAQYKCENCGVRINSGHVHHRKCLGLTPDDYNDFGNLQYLCAQCHGEAHAIAQGKQLKRQRPVPLTHGEAGHKGGSNTSEAKRRAAKINLAKARIRRWPKGAKP